MDRGVLECWLADRAWILEDAALSATEQDLALERLHGGLVAPVLCPGP